MACSAELNVGDGTKSKSTDGQPTCIIVLGMAGSGKTTFVKKLSEYLTSKQSSPYIVNLDPAVHEMPYKPNIDIRDSIDYKKIMKSYSLGPNGGILTSLNLFSVHFNQLMVHLEQRSTDHKYMIFDTPGQIEVFTWSASGTIITEALASRFPTIIVYVMDTARCTSPVTFMSNMLYACSILYKSKLPFVVALNKTDIIDCSFILEWMSDFEAFEMALENDGRYISSLTRSMSLVLDEFYSTLKATGISSFTGDGFPEFMKAIEEATVEYEVDYRPAFEKLQAAKASKDEQEMDASAEGGENVVLPSGRMCLTLVQRAEDEKTEEQEDSQEEDEEEAREEMWFENFCKGVKTTEAKR